VKSNRSIERAFSVLEFLADQPGSRLVDVSKGTGLAAPTALRFLGTLVELGYVRPLAKGYALTSKLAALNRGWRERDAAGEVESVLAGLADASECTAFLAVAEGDEVVYRNRMTPTQVPLVSTTRIGHRAPLYCTGVGKVLLAARSAEEIAAYVERTTLEALTEHTHADPAELLHHLDEVRAQGYAPDDEECEPGVRCLAAPVSDSHGRGLAALSISGPSTRFTAASREQQLRLLKRAAAELPIAVAGAMT